MKKNFKINFHRHLQFEEQVKFQLKAKQILRQVSLFEKKEIPVANQISTDNFRNDRQQSDNAKLRKIEIKKFSRDSTNWMVFIESLDAAIH